MPTKLLLIVCFFSGGVVFGQSKYATTGVFRFIEKLPIGSDYEVGPGQLSKGSDKLLLGLTTGNIEKQDSLWSDLYYIDLQNTGAGPKAIALPNDLDSIQYFQCTSSENEEVIVYVTNEYGGWNDNQLGIAYKDQNGSYNRARPLSEINSNALSDAYPWLSADGLRLYYCRDFKIFVTGRKNIQDPFAAPTPVYFNGEVHLDVVSCWLTPKEDIMYIIANNNIYISYKDKKTSAFSLPQLFSDAFKNFYFIASLSFAADKKTMYIYYSDEFEQSILKYELVQGKAW
ncbi:MAG: hypothetical protein R2794_04555 [Chitinophagales bacterium]